MLMKEKDNRKKDGDFPMDLVTEAAM